MKICVILVLIAMSAILLFPMFHDRDADVRANTAEVAAPATVHLPREVSEYERIALATARKSLSIPEGILPEITTNGTLMVVRFPIEESLTHGDKPWIGPDIYAVVEIDIETKKVLMIIGG